MPNKPESITLRVTAKFKDLATRRAKAENRSLTSYMEWLVLRDAVRHNDSLEIIPQLLDELPTRGAHNNRKGHGKGTADTLEPEAD